MVKIDVTGCQREIAEKILEKGALYERISKSLAPRYLKPVSGSGKQQLERFYRCKVRVLRKKSWPDLQGIEDLEDFLQQHQRAGLRSAILVESIREVQGNRTVEKQLCIPSLLPGAERIGGCIPSHWDIGNQLQ